MFSFFTIFFQGNLWGRKFQYIFKKAFVPRNVYCKKFEKQNCIKMSDDVIK